MNLGLQALKCSALVFQPINDLSEYCTLRRQDKHFISGASTSREVAWDFKMNEPDTGVFVDPFCRKGRSFVSSFRALKDSARTLYRQAGDIVRT